MMAFLTFSLAFLCVIIGHLLGYFGAMVTHRAFKKVLARIKELKRDA